MSYIGYKPADKPLTSADITDGIITGNDIASTFDLTGKTVTLPSGTGGKVLQVVSTTKQDTFSASIVSGTFTDVTGLSVSIIPSSTSNKILIICHVVGAIDGDSNRQFIMIKRDGSQLLGASGTASGNRISTITIQGQASTYGGATHFFNFLDSPSSTSSLTYQIAMSQGTGTTKTIYVNRGSDDDNQSYIGRASSTITVMEIAG